MDLRIIEFEDRHLDDLCRLQTLHWNGDISVNRRYFQWKYRAGPASTASRLYLAVSDDRVVGMRGYYPSRWILEPGGEPKVVLTAADLVVHPDFRQMGVSRALLDWSHRDIPRYLSPFLMNLSASKVNRVELLASGWRSLGRFSVWNRIPRLAGPLRRVGVTVGRGFDRLDAAKRPVGSALETKPRSAPMASLAARAPRAQIQLKRDEAFFLWRFENPMSEYRFLFLGEGELNAYLVVQCWRDHDHEWVNLIDYACVDPSHLAPLVSTVVGACGMHCLRVWEPGTEALRQVFAELGFRPEKHIEGVRDPRPSLLVQAIGGSDEADCELPDFAACERTMVLSDFY